MARVELIASTSETSMVAELRRGVEEAFAELDGVNVETTFESRDRAVSGAEIAIGYVVGLASGVTIELVKAVVERRLEARRVRADLELSALEDADGTDEPDA